MALSNITIGKNAPGIINVVVEIPRGSHHKYEYDDTLDAITLDRVLHSPVFYPTDYGFIPETLSTDDDHLDALVIITEPVFPGCVVRVRPVGVLDMEDDKGPDPKIVTVALGDPKLTHINTLADIDDHFKKEIESFFRQYKELENKKVLVKNWQTAETATSVIRQAMDRYQKNPKP
jgi:inorganic pyrophosphatase